MIDLAVETCESCGQEASVQLEDGSWWCRLCDGSARRLGYDVQQSYKVLSLWQPWAALIAIGEKRIETRSWKAPAALIGQRIAIHAAARIPKLGDPFDVGDFAICCARHGAWFMEGPNGEFFELEFGAILATATLEGCLPMVDNAKTGDPECIVVHGGGIDHCIPSDPDQADGSRLGINDGTMLIRDINDQLPYGDFTYGRWAWMLEDVDQFAEPVPFKGGQGLTKTWTVAR